MKRKILWALTSIILAICLLSGAVLVPFLLRVQHFPAAASSGYHADFYLYVPPGARRAAARGETVNLLVQPNNSGTNSDDPEVHRDDAWWMTFGRHWLADELEVVLLIPAFVRPSTEWWIYTHALDRDVLTTERPDLARLDLQLLAMVDTARASLAADNIPTDEKFLLQGYSASGMFVNRFTILHPERVKAAAAGSPGGWPVLPVAQFEEQPLNYPIGTADLETLTGRPFNAAAYNQVPQLIYMGNQDDNDSLDFTDGWDEEMAAVVDQNFGDDPLTRWDDAEALYQAAGANVTFLLIDDIGHDRRALQPYATMFLADILGR